MRICIPIPFRAEGGGFYFLESFRKFLLGEGWQVVDTINDHYDVLFTNHWMVSRRDILRAISRNPMLCVVQRIDGAAQDYGRSADADRRQRAVNYLADVTIFQSDYCHYSTRTKFPVIVNDGPVITNPVDIDTFRPDGRRVELPGSIRVACATWSTNPMKGAAEIYAVAAGNPSVDFHLCGRYLDSPTLRNIHQHGVLGRQDLANVLRSCHVLLTFSRNEACPNHVLEALASGLPVLYHDSGAAAEVVRDCGRPVTTGNFAEQLAAIMSNHAALGNAARNCAVDDHHPDRIFKRYLDAIEVAVRRPRAWGTRYVQSLLEVPVRDAAQVASAVIGRVQKLFAKPANGHAGKPGTAD